MAKNSSETQVAMEGPMSGDLETLRDILFGNQARATEDRLDQLERQLAAARRDLQESFTKRLDALTEKSSSQLGTAREELSQRLAKQDSQQGEQLKATREELAASIKQLGDQLREELQLNFRQLNEQLEASNVELSERLLAAQEEARQRNGDLRQELLTLSAWLDDKKASRHDLGQMLLNIGQQLQQETTQATNGQES
jgi:hypothetical protein